MSKLLKVVGIVSLVVVGVMAVTIGSLVAKGVALDHESRAYVDAAIPAIASTWDKQQLMGRASPELVKAIDAARLQSLYKRFEQLGPIVSFEPPKGQAGFFYSTSSSASQEVASYVSEATFQNGTATMRVSLLKRDGRWMIHGFFIDAIKIAPPDHA